MKKRFLTSLFGLVFFLMSNINFNQSSSCSASSPMDAYTSKSGLKVSSIFSRVSDQTLSLIKHGFISGAQAKPSKENSSSSYNLSSGSDKADLVFTFKGHSASVSTMSFSHDGKMLASGGWDNSVKVWDVQNKKLIFDLNAHTGGITSLAFHPKHHFLASTSLDSSIRIWEIKNEMMNVNNIDASQNNYYASTTSKSGTLNASNYKIFPVLTINQAHKNWINTIAFSPNGRYIASGGWDNNVKIWDAQTGKCVKTFKGHNSAILDVVFSKDGKTLISSSKDETIKFWSIPHGTIIHQITGHSGWIMSIGLNANGSILASGGSDETISLWDLAAKQDTALELRRFLGHKDYVRSLTFSPNGDILASGGDDNKLKFWNLKTGKEIYEIEGHTSWVRSVAYNPSGNLIASAGDDMMINLWKADKAVELMKQNAALVKKKTVSKAKKIAYRRKALIKRKCNRCHTYRAVESKFTPRNITSVVERMRKYPNSGFTKKESREIIRYLKTTIKSRY